MKKYTDEELNKIIENHQHWLNEDCEGWETMRADLSGSNLSGSNLSGSNLRGSDLSGSNLRGSDLSGSNLRDSNLRGSDLNGSNLRGSDLRGSDLSGSNLRYSNLRGSDLSGSNLRGSDLSGSNLRYSNLRGSNLNGSNLNGSDLNGSRYDERTSFFALQCPEKGAFIGFKKVNGYIVELEIPAEAKRSSATTRKCRCEFARVLSITNKDGSDSGLTAVHNDNYCGCDYVVGEIVRADEWDDDRWNECSHGIHFFITRDEAVIY